MKVRNIAGDETILNISENEDKNNNETSIWFFS
jgi:hypothetical protein